LREQKELKSMMIIPIFRLGTSFQIESCTYNTEEGLWLINASATDKGADIASEYIQYQKGKVAESNIVLMFGHLLIETGEYVKAEKYFDAILRSSNPNDEEIACIYHNIGRAYRLKAEYERALVCLNRSYETHLEARPPRLISAARTINTIGIVYMEQGYFDRAEESFGHALKLYAKTIHRHHADIGGTLINLADLHCQQGRFDKALFCFTRAQKIYERSLPANHPNIALALNNLGILHYQQSQYDLAIDAFNRALIVKEKVLPADHPSLARTAHNLAVAYAVSGRYEEAELFFERTAKCALPETHPFMEMLKNNTIKCQMAMQIGISMEDIDISEIDKCPIIHF
jgi:tetratricopeptide (TPR) repeat protein